MMYIDVGQAKKQDFRAVFKGVLKNTSNKTCMTPLSQLAEHFQKIKTQPSMICMSRLKLMLFHSINICLQVNNGISDQSKRTRPLIILIKCK